MTQPTFFPETAPDIADHRVESIAAASARLQFAEPEEILEWGFDEFGDRISIATGFGAEGIALIDMAVKINANPDIFFLDTEFLFPETYELRDRLEQRYSIRIRAVTGEYSAEAQARQFGDRLWESDPDLCCRLRKLEPMKAELSGLDAWVTAIRRDQSDARAAAQSVEWDSKWQLTKINPLVRWSRDEVWSYIRARELPYNPLHDRGYPSIGCTHCTSSVSGPEHERAGRWRGHKKTECGLHGSAPAPVISVPRAGASGSEDRV